MKHLIILQAIILLFIASCTKTKEIIVSGNQAPDDPTIENVIIENYVIKLYISLFGREPVEEEFDYAFNLLRDNELNKEARDKIADELLNDEEYYMNLYVLIFKDILPEKDTTVFTEALKIINNKLENAMDPNFIADLEYELNRLLLAREMPLLFTKQEIDIKEVYKRMVNNEVYDEINMGTENFVISLFDFFLHRYPTVDELENSKNIVDDKSDIIFLQYGSSKDDFLDIFFSSNEFLEGQVIYLYNKHLYRDPDTEEMAELTYIYHQNGDFNELQKYIFTLDEYIGI
jgi:hypothetical protein